MRPIHNPLVPRPQSFHGTPAWGGTEGGVHTADTLAQAVAYANIKGEPPDDYPVVLGLDTRGLRRLPDLDVKRAAENLKDALGGMESVEDVLHDYEDPYESEAFGHGDSTQNWLFAVTEPASSRNFYGAFRSYLEDVSDEERQRSMFRRAKVGDLSPEEKMSIWGQGRYLDPIGSDRVISVYYVHPFWPTILPVWDDEDLDFESLQDENPGYAFIFEDEEDTADPASAAGLAWRKEDAPERVEYHGTSWRNFSSAFPNLARKLPVPPQPFDPAD